jgi:hypothetical protein
MGKSLPNYEPAKITDGKNRTRPSFYRIRGASPVEAGKLAKHEQLRHILYLGFR